VASPTREALTDLLIQRVIRDAASVKRDAPLIPTDRMYRNGMPFIPRAAAMTAIQTPAKQRVAIIRMPPMINTKVKASFGFLDRSERKPTTLDGRSRGKATGGGAAAGLPPNLSSMGHRI